MEFLVQEEGMLRGLFHISGLETSRDGPCKVRNQTHPVWKCEVLKGMDNKKWETSEETRFVLSLT